MMNKTDRPVTGKVGTAALLLLLAAVLASSCSGGGTQADPPETTGGFISGTVTVTGLPLANLDDSSIVGDQDADKWSAWLIDTTEDIDSIEIDTGDQVLQTTTVPKPGIYFLEIGLLPAADLSGGTATTTEVTVSLPVTIAENLTTIGNISVEFVADASASSLHGASQAGTGYSIRLDYSLNGPEQHRERVELHWLNRTLRSDQDGDGLFDNEPEFFDTDRDCLSDAQFERIKQGPHQPQALTAEGTVSHVSMQMRNLRIGSDTFRIDEGTRFRRNGSPVHPTELDAGDTVRIEYFQGMNRMLYALSIDILE